MLRPPPQRDAALQRQQQDNGYYQTNAQVADQ